jgi:8-oxo-dGTP pyrophosphatase MutT (NUDIX family)
METFKLKIFEPPVDVRIMTEHVTEVQLMNWPHFTNWAKTLKDSLELQTQLDHKGEKHPFHEFPYTLRSVDIQAVDWFGKGKLGFVKLTAKIQNEAPEPQTLPGGIFLRGGSVAMLMILRPSDSITERWVVMTEQPRIPAGSLRFWEIPAGMIDDDTDDFSGTAAKEIRQETGLVVPRKELINLTELALADTKVDEALENAMYPSPGGCDEFIAIFLWEKVMDRQEIENMKGKLTGIRGEGENVTVRILNYEDLWRVGARDAKTLAAWSLYEALKRVKNPQLMDVGGTVDVATGRSTRSKRLKRKGTAVIDKPTP